MQVNVLLKWAMSLIMMSALFSCADHVPPVATTQYRVKRIGESGAKSSYASEFFYNNAGKIEKRINYSGGSSSQVSSVGQPVLYSYDSQGRIVSTENQLVPGYYFSMVRNTYEYDPSGLVKTIKRYQSPSLEANFSLYDTSTLEYNEQKLVSKITTQPVPDPINLTVIPPVYVTTYSYVNGNITAIETSGGSLTRFDVGLYDNKPNPYYSVRIYPGEPVSRNNYVDPKSQFTYSNAGLPVSVINNYKEEYRFQYFRNFDYETY
jgi:hypothetical protein